MKVTIDIDCTPEEARTFLGLPDVKPLQDEMMREMADKMRQGVEALSPEQAMKLWLPAGTQAAEQFQKMFAQFYGLNKD